MKAQISAVFRGLSVGRRFAIALILCGLVGSVSYLAVTEAQNEVEETPQQSPLMGVTSSTDRTRSKSPSCIGTTPT